MTDFAVYLTKRLVYTVVVLFVISAIIFSLTQILPGSAATTILGQMATDEKVEAQAEKLGLDRPVHVQYIDWVSGVLVADMGTSFIYKKQISDVVAPRLWRSLQLAFFSLALVILLGIPLGVITAILRGTAVDSVISAVTYAGVSLPEFVTGTFVLLLFGGPILSVFPSGGYVPPSEGLIPWARHMFLPALTLTILLLAHVLRQTRSEMIDVLQSEYIRTARLKGMGEYDVIVKHALRNGLLPTITVLALQLGWLMGGLVIVEEVFTFPGIGRLVVEAIKNRDLPLIQATILIIAATYTFANLGADIVYTYLDPRIEYGEG